MLVPGIRLSRRVDRRRCCAVGEQRIGSHADDLGGDFRHRSPRLRWGECAERLRCVPCRDDPSSRVARAHCEGIGGAEKADLWTGKSRAHLHKEVITTRNQARTSHKRGEQHQVELSREGHQRLRKRASTKHRKRRADVA